METTQFSWVIRGHVWQPIHGQILQCARETSNRFDPFAVSIVNNDEIVHGPHAMNNSSCMCAVLAESMYVRTYGTCLQ